MIVHKEYKPVTVTFETELELQRVVHALREISSSYYSVGSEDIKEMRQKLESALRG